MRDMKLDTLKSSLVELWSLENNELPSIMLWSQPGAGKSAVIQQVATALEEAKKKKVIVNDVRLLLMNPIDLRGIPVADDEKENAVWLKPEIFDMDPSDDIINILFLDELSAAPPSVQASAYQLVLDRQVGEHKLPDNVVIVGAGNRVTDKSVAYKMPLALANRFTHFTVEVDFDAWKTWALTDGEIDQKVMGFLNYRPALLNQFDPSSPDLAFPTPRTWEMSSKYLKSMPFQTAMTFLAGTIGAGPAVEFETYCKVYTQLPNLLDIANGVYHGQKKEPSVLYALVSALVFNSKKMSKPQLANTLKYLMNMSPEFSILAGKDMLRMKETRKNLIGLPEWQQWIDKFGKYLPK